MHYLLSKVALILHLKGIVVNSFNWVYNFDPSFPIYIFSYDVQGNQDRLHWHDYYEIGLCIEGSGKFIYLNKEYPVTEGDIFLTNNFENHVAITEGQTHSRYIFLIFLPSFIADPRGRHLDLEYLFPFHYNPLFFENRLPAKSKAAQRIADLILDAYAIYEEKGDFHRITLDIKLRQILLEFSRHYASKQSHHVEGHGHVDANIQKAIRYINLHFNERLTIQRISEILEMSPSYFRHLFSQNVRISVKQYITHLRMSQAKKLLLASDKPVSEIIEDVGYFNATHFYRTFKKYVQMTPAEYRKHYRGVPLTNAEQRQLEKRDSSIQ